LESFAALNGENGFAGLLGSFKFGAKNLATNSQEGVGSGVALEHTRLLHTPSDDGLTPYFNDFAADKIDLRLLLKLE